MRSADAASGPGERATPPSIWWTRRAVAFHVTLVVVVPVFLGLFWWQVQRVRQGNTLSWAYVFEWPFFTGYAVYLWWKLVHDQPDGAAAADGAAGTTAAAREARVEPMRNGNGGGGAVRGAEGHQGEEAREEAARRDGAEEDDELAAYNRYLAQRNASGRRKSW